MFTWGSFLALWGKTLIQMATMLLMVGAAFYIGRRVERKDAQRYFSTYHEALSRDNVARYRLEAERYKALSVQTAKDNEKISVALRATEVLLKQALQTIDIRG